MTQLPEPENHPKTRSNRRLWLLLLGRIGVPLLIVGLAAIAGGIWYGWKFVNEQLAPLVETNLSQLLKRPVQLGRVESFSFNQLRFGKSAIPATQTDRDRATVESVEVAFNPLQVLLTRNLNLDITLDRPNLYLDQEKDGVWVKTQIEQREEAGPIKTELKKVRLRDAEIELAPYPKEGSKRVSVKLKEVTGDADFFDRGRRIAYELEGQSLTDGTVDIKGEALVEKGLNTKLNVRGQNFLVAEIDRLVKLPINLLQGRVNGAVDIELRPNQRTIVKGTANFKDVTVQIPRLPQTFTKTSGNLQINDTLIKLEDTTAQLGKIPLLANGTIDTQKGYALSVKVKSVTLANFFDTFAVQFPFAAAGEVTAAVKVGGAIDRPILTGTTQTLKPAKVDRVDLKQARADFRLDAQTLQLAVNNVQASPTVGGQIAGDGILNLDEPRSLAFDFQAQNVPGDAIARLYNATPTITIGRVNAQGRISGSLDNVQTVAQWQAPEATYPAVGEVAIAANGNTVLRNAVLQVAGGTVTASGEATNGRWQGVVRAAGVQASRFAPGVQGRVSGDFQLAGTTDFRLADIRATGQARLTEGIGTVNARINANAGRWQADTQIAGIRLNQFSQQLRGNFSGDLRVNGSLDSFSPANIRADGRVRLSEGIALIDQPITAQVAWDGRRVNVQQATAPGFSANGSIFARLEGTPAVTALDLNIRTNGYALANLPVPRPPVTQLTGAIDLAGRVTGTPDAPNVAADVAVRGLSLNGITFDPVLNGTLRLNPTQGFSVNVAGTEDRINLALSPTYRPISLDVQHDGAIVTGRATGSTLFNINVQQLALDGFVLPGVSFARLGGVGGRLSGNFNIDLNRLQVVDGTASVEELRIGSLKNSGFTTRFVNRSNVFRFGETVLTRNQSRYAVSGDLDLRSTPKFNGTVAIAQGSVEDLLQTIQVFRLEDFARGLTLPTYGKSGDLQAAAVGNPNATLADQLRRFYEITALLNQTTEARQNSSIPELANVRGTFDGKVNFSASLDAGVQAEFNLTGQNLEWRPYPPEYDVVNRRLQVVDSRVLKADQVNLIGTFADGKVNFDPLLVQSGDATIRLTGNFGGDTQQGQLTVNNIPIEEINRFYPLPLGISGKLNSSIVVSGSRGNPQAFGEISLTDGFLNNTPIQSATGQFQYFNARLNLGSNIRINTPEPIRISGTIPYRLPFVTVYPETNDIDLKLQVKNEGLAFLNLLTPQIAWQEGEGAVNLQIGGSLFRPNVQGSAVLNNATIAAQALPEPLTGVTGTILFDRDRLRINQPLQGQFSRGRVSAQGVLPILAALDGSDPDAANPLSVSLDRLAVNLKSLYQGGVNGNVTVAGSLFAPELSGNIRLTDGQVLLSDTTPTAGGADDAPTSENENTVQSQVLRLNNLKLALGDRVQILRAPILNFLARGELTVNGTLDAPDPSGTITLRSGQVNVFTTQFVLARGYPQTAKFLPGRGLDPELDVRLIASVPEVTRTRAPNPNLFSSEISDDSLFATGLGALQTVRIQARATGPASQLFNNLELTSSPSRSREEIIALIGGGFVNTLGRGDSTLGIANLAGSALLTNIQGFIGNAIGLSEFRLFPTLLRNERRESTLGLAAELGVDITGSLSASVLRVLTADQPTQFGVRYRINDQLLFRGSTDFSGDNRAVFEFETRF